MECWFQTKYANYIVSTYGRIYNTKTKNYPNYTNPSSNGYVKVSLSSPGTKAVTRELHRVIAETIVPGYQPGLVVDHIDGNKTNNHISNLRWVTVSVNVTGTRTGKGNKKLTKKQKEEVKRLYKNGMSLIKITEYMNKKYNRTSARATYTAVVRK